MNRQYSIVGVSDVTTGFGSPEVPALMDSLARHFQRPALLIQPDEISRRPPRGPLSPRVDVEHVCSTWETYTPPYAIDYLRHAAARVNRLRPEVLEQLDLPRCPHCGGVLKPDVVLFGEALPWATWRAAEEAVQQADVLLVAGSSLEVYPVADLPYQAARRGTKVILVNLAPTAFDPYAEVLLRGDVAEVLPALVDVARAFPEVPDSV